MTINVVATLTVRPGSGPALEAAVAEARKDVMNEPGCVRYDLQRKFRSETDYIMLETWESVADLKTHGQAPAFVAFSAKAADILAAAPEVLVYEPVGEQV